VAEKPDQIERHIASTRSELGTHLQELEDKVKQAADWKTYYERSPMTMLGLAFGGGVLLAGMAGGRRQSARPAYPSQRDTSAARGTQNSAQSSAIYDTWQNVRAALIGLSGAKLCGLLNQALPGFSEHYEKVARRNPTDSTASPPPGREYEVPVHRM
jgi:hypothetical protein